MAMGMDLAWTKRGPARWCLRPRYTCAAASAPAPGNATTPVGNWDCGSWQAGAGGGDRFIRMAISNVSGRNNFGGTLSLLRNGDAELRSRPDGELVGTGVAPWTYAPPQKGESTVRVRFSIDVSGDMLYYSGAVDAWAGPDRRLAGAITTGFDRKVG